MEVVRGNGYGNDFLVITRVGRFRYFEGWIGDPDRRFDIFLSAYIEGVSNANTDGVYGEFRPGRKVAGIAALFNEHIDFIKTYQYVAILDEDIEISAEKLSTAFSIARENEFLICQPSLTHDSYFSYAALLQNAAFEFRALNFIEMMAPIFRTDTVETIRDIYALGYESGIDLVWCNILEPRPGNFAVIDEVAMRHGQPVGVRKAENGFVGSRRYEDDIEDILVRFDLEWFPCVPYYGQRKNRKFKARLYLLVRSIRLLSAAFLQKPYWPRLRAVLVYWKHLLFERPANAKRSIDSGRLGQERH